METIGSWRLDSIDSIGPIEALSLLQKWREFGAMFSLVIVTTLKPKPYFIESSVHVASLIVNWPFTTGVAFVPRTHV
jgi:hypothetical protein